MRYKDDLDDLVTRPSYINIPELSIKTGEDIDDLVEEIDGYWEVLLGNEKPPYDKGVMTLMEYAQDVYARSMYIQYQILQLERDGAVEKNSPLYKFRTGELRTFIEVAKSSSDLGSRRITFAKMEHEQIMDGMA